MTVREPGFWPRWCALLWKEAEGAWINREGQDHAYRRLTVIPALAGELHLNGEGKKALIDVGCGDGSATAALINAMPQEFMRPRAFKEAILLDRSKTQLDSARRIVKKSSDTVRAYEVDACSESAVTGIYNVASTVLNGACWVSIFVMQELHDLRPFMKAVGGAMRTGERLYTVVVAPTFAQKLLKTKRAVMDGVGTQKDDFICAIRYPVDAGNGRLIFLPHFQRRLSDYKKAGTAAGLALEKSRQLIVPRTEETESIFLRTVYGEDIFRFHSSLLLTYVKL